MVQARLGGGLEFRLQVHALIVEIPPKLFPIPASHQEVHASCTELGRNNAHQVLKVGLQVVILIWSPQRQIIICHSLCQTAACCRQAGIPLSQYASWRDGHAHGLAGIPNASSRLPFAPDRILAPSVYIFFCSAIPALAFGEQLVQETGEAVLPKLCFIRAHNSNRRWQELLVQTSALMNRMLRS